MITAGPASATRQADSRRPTPGGGENARAGYNAAMLRFRLLGIPHEVTPFFWLGSALLSGYLTRGGENAVLLVVVWVLCVLVSIVAHELGHALAARRYGVQPFVVLQQFGGLTYLPGATLSRWQHIVVSLAGPAAGGAMYLAVHTVRHLLRTFGVDDVLYDPGQTGLIVQTAIKNLLYINGVWTLFNLLPIQPLDGGQVLGATLGPRWTVVTRAIGGVCATACCLWALQAERLYTAFFLGYFAYANFVGDTRSLPGGVGGDRVKEG